MCARRSLYYRVVDREAVGGSTCCLLQLSALGLYLTHAFMWWKKIDTTLDIDRFHTYGTRESETSCRPWFGSARFKYSNSFVGVGLWWIPNLNMPLPMALRRVRRQISSRSFGIRLPNAVPKNRAASLHWLAVHVTTRRWLGRCAGIFIPYQSVMSQRKANVAMYS